jgi:hypothetical protein
VPREVCRPKAATTNPDGTPAMNQQAAPPTPSTGNH